MTQTASLTAYQADGDIQAELPLRVACVDCGSNAIRFQAREFETRTTSTVLDYTRAPVRLGHGVFLTGKLLPESMDRAIEAFRSFRARMEELKVQHYRAVATSAIRESRNGEEFMARLRKETGLELEIINGSEEARLAHAAIQARMDLGRDRWILVDLGGGSVEISLVDDSGILWSESHTMGSVRLLEELAGAEKDSSRFRRVLSNYIATLRIPSAGQYQKITGFIGTGGNISSLAKLAGAVPDGNGVSVFSIRDLQSVMDTLFRLSFKQRVEELGLREDRADVILPAALVYERLADLVGAERIHVPHVGIADGVLLDLVDALTGRRAHGERVERDVYNAALNVGRKYSFDESHAVQVAALAVSMFDQLREVHGLAPENRRILSAAALLHDIGSFISKKRHHRHSQYLISQSEVAGMSPEEIELTAAVARYHRKGSPGPDHIGYGQLEAADQERVAKLAAILRIADALDREHRQAVKRVRVFVENEEVILEPISSEELLLERFALQRRAQLFRKVFQRRVRVRTGKEGK